MWFSSHCHHLWDLPVYAHWQLPSGYRLLLGPAERACTHRRRMGRTARRSRSQPAISTTCATRGGPPMAPPASNGRQLIDDSPEIAAARSVALLHTGTSPAPALLNSTALVVGHTLRKLSKYQHCNDPYGTKKQKIGKLPCARMPCHHQLNALGALLATPTGY